MMPERILYCSLTITIFIVPDGTDLLTACSESVGGHPIGIIHEQADNNSSSFKRIRTIFFSLWKLPDVTGKSQEGLTSPPRERYHQD